MRGAVRLEATAEGGEGSLQRGVDGIMEEAFNG